MALFFLYDWVTGELLIVSMETQPPFIMMFKLYCLSVEVKLNYMLHILMCKSFSFTLTWIQSSANTVYLGIWLHVALFDK